MVSLNAWQAKPGVHLIDTTLCVSLSMNTQPSVPAFIIHANLKCKKYIHLCDEICICFHFKVGNKCCGLCHVDWWNLMKQSVTVGAQLSLGGHYGCNNGHDGCDIVMSYTKINKAVSQWLLTLNLCVSVTWPLTCAFHIPCMDTPEITGACVMIKWDSTIKCNLKYLLQAAWFQAVYKTIWRNWPIFY